MKTTLQKINTADQNLQLIQSSMQRSLDQVRAYDPANTAFWADPKPTSVEDAIERLAQLLYIIHGAEIP